MWRASRNFYGRGAEGRKKNGGEQSFIKWLDGIEPYIYAYLNYTPEQFLSFTLPEASKVLKGVELRIEAEDYRWNGQMQILRWIGSIIWNKPVYGYKSKRKAVEPEKLFRLPGDREVKQIPQATKEQLELAQKKAKLLQGVI